MDEVQKLEQEVLRHRDLYYNQSQPEITDAEYDALEVKLREQDPDSEVLKQTGAPLVPSAWEKFEHPYHVGSLAKVKNLDELREWASQFPPGTKFHVSQKLDGLAIVSYFENGILVRAVTRGNGQLGEDVTSNYLKMLGAVKKFGVEGDSWALRGEVTLSHKFFNEYFEGYTNPRNAASGATRELAGSKAQHLQVSYFDIQGMDLDWDRKSVWQLFGDTDIPAAPEYGLLTIDELCKKYPEIETERETLGYDIDGLVIWVACEYPVDQYGLSGDDTPKAAIALKFPDLEKSGKIQDIRWDYGLGGRLTPVAVLEESLFLAGANITHVSLHNLDQIHQSQVTVGATIGVVRSGEVIPYMTRVIEPGKPYWDGLPLKEDKHKRFSEDFTDIQLDSINFPMECPECGAETQLKDAYVYCVSRECPGNKRGRILRWITSLGLKQIGEGLVTELVKLGKLNDPADLYHLTAEDVEQVERKSAKHFEKVQKALTLKKELSFVDFMAALGIPHAGKKVWTHIQRSGIKTLHDLKWAGPSDYAQADRMGEKRALEIYTELRELWPVIERLREVGITIKETVKDGKLSGKSFCITGSIGVEIDGKKATKKVLGALLEQHGGIMEGSVTKSLDYLILSDSSSTSGKAKKAREYGTRLMSPEEVLALVV